MGFNLSARVKRMWRRLYPRDARKRAAEDGSKRGSKWPDISPCDSPFSRDLEENLRGIARYLAVCDDVSIRRFGSGSFKMALMYVEGFADAKLIQESVLSPLMKNLEGEGRVHPKTLFQPETLAQETITSHDVEIILFTQDAVNALLEGYSLLLGAGWDKALRIDTKGMRERNIEEPEAEVAVRGPRDGFTEDIVTNLSLIRRRIKHPYFRTKMLVLGKLTRSKVAVVYIEGLARNDLLDEVMARLNRIDIDAVMESGVIEEFIEDSPFSPFPLMDITERPDRVATFLTEGKVGILVDGTPFTITVPVTLAALIRHPEDYYNRWLVVSLFRLVRYFGAFISLTLPSFYVALTAFHQELLPRSLALSLAVQRENIPYPALVETLVMLITFEILTEATVRLPRTLGQTIGIVGALVIGESAVRADLISAAMVIVVSLTALSQFTLPYPLTLSMRLLRLPLLFLTAVLGLFGIFFGLIVLLLYTASLRSFGMPFLSPFAPLRRHEMTDTVVRLPWWAKTKRVAFIGDRQPYRMKTGLMPRKPEDLGKALELDKDSEPD